ncbi:hypothetical protein EI94DRAFT_839663 [Lactarius quietus]|nr:hypothetical protein EI94DRAFT_839663 [Lactarius quietus]
MVDKISNGLCLQTKGLGASRMSRPLGLVKEHLQQTCQPFDDMLDDRNKVGPADEDNVILGTCPFGAALTEHGPIWHISGHQGSWSWSWSWRRWPHILDQRVRLSITEVIQSAKGWPLYGREKTEDKSGLALAPRRTRYWAGYASNVASHLCFFFCALFCFIFLPRVDKSHGTLL